MLTLNQEIEILKNFSLKHKGLNSFFYGPKSDKDAEEKITYPNMQAVLQSSSKSGDIITRKFYIAFSDLVKVNQRNENHVLSDMELIAYDFLYYLEDVETNGGIGLEVIKNTELSDFIEDSDDVTAGFGFEVSLTTHIEGFSCNLPINAGSIMDSVYIYAGNTIGQDFQVLIKDQDGNTLQTFNTSGTYIVEVLSAIRDTITGNSAAIIDQIN